ncbi:hypothetical protein MVEN_01334600 [Mycena venus]|uniref:Armadillo repeat-containing protein 8 n=1 Tax=Mycena venus TaxID=2733690 RepID=A0A8H7CU33_9AGAR|nr:hypothetical protein MVEN_01334600 [Mycena venus]
MRPPSPQSIHSWWSYSNPPGPTISLHPLAIRLGKLLYHRRVVGILKRQGSHPLSPQKLDAFIPYLQFNEILPSTKIAILEQINLTSQFELGAEAIVDASLLQVLVCLLTQSPDPRILRLICSILFRVSCHEELKGHIIDAHAFQPLVLLLQNPETAVRIAAARALEEMTSISDFAAHEPQVIDSASLLFLGDLLHSTDHTLRRVACKILSAIAASGHEILTRLIIDMSSNIPFLSLIRNQDPPVRNSAVHLLSRITPCITTGGRAKVFDVAMLVALMDSLKSNDSEVGLPVWTCRILQYISSDESMVQAIVDTELPTQLVSLLRDSNQNVHFAVLSSLYQMGSQVKSDLVARNITGAGALPLLIDLLRSECGEIPKLACGILGHIASHPILVEVMVSKNVTTALTSLLRLSGKPIHRAAASTLWQISCQSETGAAAVAEALVGLLHCTDNIPCMIAACEVLGTIAGEVGVIEADINPCLHIAALVGHPDLMVRDAALAALHKVSRVSNDGACTVSKAIISNADTALPKVTLFLRSLDVNTLLRTCDIVASIACGDHARKFIIPSDLCAAILSLSQHPVIAVNHVALSALVSISARSEKQAEAVASRSSLRQLVDLLASHDSNVLDLTCQILANIACHHILLAAVIETELCPPVAALLRHSRAAVSVAAMSALCWISRQLAGACAVVNAKVLPEVWGIVAIHKYRDFNCCFAAPRPPGSGKSGVSQLDRSLSYFGCSFEAW